MNNLEKKLEKELKQLEILENTYKNIINDFYIIKDLIDITDDEIYKLYYNEFDFFRHVLKQNKRYLQFIELENYINDNSGTLEVFKLEEVFFLIKNNKDYINEFYSLKRIDINKYINLINIILRINSQNKERIKQKIYLKYNNKSIYNVYYYFDKKIKYNIFYEEYDKNFYYNPQDFIEYNLIEEELYNEDPLLYIQFNNIEELSIYLINNYLNISFINNINDLNNLNYDINIIYNKDNKHKRKIKFINNINLKDLI